MYICYGISNGPYYRGPRDIWEEDQFLWHTPLNREISCEEKDELVLVVPDFDSTKSMPVQITLRRNGSDMPLVAFMVNSYDLVGKPELVWGPA